MSCREDLHAQWHRQWPENKPACQDYPQPPLWLYYFAHPQPVKAQQPAPSQPRSGHESDDSMRLGNTDRNVILWNQCVIRMNKGNLTLPQLHCH